MNKKIRELAKEHGFVHDFMTVGEYNDALQKFEKFAELIVRECAEISKTYAGGSMPLSIALAIREHFGVKA